MKIRKIIAFIALTAILMACMGQAGEFVLCFEENGHIALKPSKDGHCEGHHDNTAQTTDSSSNNLFVTSKRGHVDIPLSISSLDGKYTHPHKILSFSKPNQSVINGEWSSTSLALENIATENYQIARPPDINHSILSLRTVIFLI
ncbi:MAG: hypothetical protein HOC71_15235 [Candidatus Latescibacteria bacterium]|jgi:hypothetical protein|nr:hypothetical protein [Candidatus Latescibacterota bacterium]